MTKAREELQKFLKKRVQVREAEALGISRTQFNAICTGRRKPTLEQAVEIERRYHITPKAWLIKK